MFRNTLKFFFLLIIIYWAKCWSNTMKTLVQNQDMLNDDMDLAKFASCLQLHGLIFIPKRHIYHPTALQGWTKISHDCVNSVSQEKKKICSFLSDGFNDGIVAIESLNRKEQAFADDVWTMKDLLQTWWVTEEWGRIEGGYVTLPAVQVWGSSIVQGRPLPLISRIDGRSTTN